MWPFGFKFLAITMIVFEVVVKLSTTIQKSRPNMVGTNSLLRP